MGEQQSKVNAWRLSVLVVLLVLTFLVSGVGFFVVNWEKNLTPAMKLNASGDNIVRYWGTEVGEMDMRRGVDSGGFSERKDKVCYIRTPGELAFMRYAISTSGRSNSTEDYTGYTFELVNNIDLSTDSANVKEYVRDDQGEIIYKDGRPLEKVVTVNPYWVPVEIGTLGKNKNITFNGNGYKISGLHIKYENLGSAKNAGFFASMIGGAVSNVTFVNPVIEYNYNGESVDENNPDRPESPTDVCVGIVAGSVDSTYINNVDIINPKITFTTNNNNAHNFCIGGAVGKMTFTRKNETESINTAWPKQWGLDRVKICKDEEDNTKQPEIAMTVQQGTNLNTTYGKATYGYFGGLVGVNVSSKIINSTLQDALLTPQIESNVAGTYYVGGLAGLTTQIASGEQLIVAAGLYNNLVKNINLAMIADSVSRYCGNLVGRIYSGSWAYNNLVIGVTNGYTNDGKLWKNVTNKIVYYEDVIIDSCIGHVLNGTDEYYFSADRIKIGDCVPSGDHSHCTTHQKYTSLPENVRFEDAYFSLCTGDDASEEMAQYNFSFTSVADYISSQFVTDAKYHLDDISLAYSKSELLSLIDNFYTLDNEGQKHYERGLLFYAALPILRYEIGLTVDKINPNTNEELDYDEKLLESVYQFCRWVSGPNIGDVFGKKYTIKFKANGYTDERYPNDYSDENLRGKLMQPISEAYFTDNENIGYVNINDNEQSIVRTYRQLIYKPESKVFCDGYEFMGWKIENYEDMYRDDPNFPSYLRPYVDVNGYYQFGIESVTEDRTLVAMWRLGTYYVRYWKIDPEGIEEPELLNPQEEVINGETYRYSYKIKYDSLIERPIDPVSDQGFLFEGWYTQVSGNGIVDSDVYQWDARQKMPGKDLDLYTGWKNNSEKLDELLNKNDKYREYYNNYDQYFDDISGLKYFNAFRNADYAYYHPDEKKGEYGTLIKNLEDCFDRLTVDPAKLKEKLDAFDENRIENLCPFLYQTNAYLNYTRMKKTINDYIDDFARSNPYFGLNLDESVELDEATLVKLKHEITVYISYYNQMKNEFEKLSSSYKPGMTNSNGELLSEVIVMKDKYLALKANYNTLVDNGGYDKYDMRAVENAKRILEQYWEFDVEDRKDNVPLSEINAAVVDYENAWNSKKLKIASSEGDGGYSDSSGSKGGKKSLSGVSPIVLSAVVVSVLAVVTFGYIGVDFGLNKRRLTIKKANNAKNGVVDKTDKKDDDDTYI